jgi:hypothetical protein
MDARGGRATSGAARIENGQTFNRPEIKTDRVSNSQATGHLEQTRDGRDRGEGEEMSASKKPTPAPGQFSALDYIARARQFRRGAHKLEDIEGGEPNWPKYALLGHAVELALKAVPKYFEQSRAYQKPKTVEPANHDLVGQYQWAKLHGLASNELN